MPTLIPSFAQSFASSVRSKGENYVREGRVSIELSDSRRAEFSVKGTQSSPYLVLFARDDRRALAVACDCPHSDDGHLCKHIWASLLQAERDRAPILSPAPEQIRKRDFDELDDKFFGEEAASGLEEEDDEAPPRWVQPPLNDLPAARPTLAERETARSQPAEPKWMQALDGCLDLGGGSSLHGRTPATIEYVVNVGRSMTARGLVVETYSRRQSAHGEPMLARLVLNAHGLMAELAGQDAELFRMFQALDGRLQSGANVGRPWNPYSYGSYADQTSVTLTSFHAEVLRALCETGRCRWVLNTGASVLAAPVLRWDDGPPYRLRLTGHPDGKKKQWIVRAELVRDQEAPVPLSSVVHPFSETLLFADRVARGSLRDHQNWVQAFRKADKLVVPFTDRETFVAALWSSPTRPELDLPPELTLRQESLAPIPRFVLTPVPVASYPQKLPAQAEFQYGNVSVRANDPRRNAVDVAAGVVIPRDLAAEGRWLAGLPEHGIEPVRSAATDGPDLGLPRKTLAEIVPRLTDLGWTVVAEGRAIRRPGEFKLSVSSGVDWFDLDGTFDFGGVSAKLPALLEAARDGRKYVLLDDGTQGILPAEWLQRFGGLSGLGESQEEVVRFRPSQAMLLDSLLAAQSGSTSDTAFAEYCQRLRSFSGVKAKSAPAGFQGKLRGYQKEGLGWLAFLREFRIGGCLADDMGLGKTIQVLCHLEALRSAVPQPKGASTASSKKRKTSPAAVRKPSLVVVPKSLVFNWRDEAARFTPNLKVVTYTGIERHESFESLETADLIVTTYGTLRRDILKLKDLKLDTLILDEAQAIKNANSHSAKACRLLQADHRLAMTGTPIENHLGELWSLFEFLNPGMLGRSSAFQAVARQTEAGSPAIPMLARAIAPYVLRRTKAQVLTELPEKTEQTLYVDLPAKHRKLYDELRDHFRASLSATIESQGLAQSKLHVLEALLRLRQAACHPALVDGRRAKEGSAKLEALLEQVEEVVAEGHKVLVFSQFTSLLSLVRKSFDARKIVYEYLDGKTTNRKAGVERFQNDADCPVFLISLKAGGHGLNLTAADYVFILDPWWNPAVEAQAIDRAHRMGQSKRVFAYRIIARDTVEEKVLELQRQKKELADALISENPSLIRRLTAEDLQLLLS